MKHILEDGPAMQALTRKQRDFVLAYVHCPTASGADLARMAGYSTHRNGRYDTAGTQGWRSVASRMLRMPSIIAAINECLGKTYRGRGAAIAQDVMLTIASNPDHPQQLRAAAMLADRGGFAVASVSSVTIEHRDLTSEAMIKRIELLARRLGIDAAKLLGGPTIDVGASEVGPADVAGLRDQSAGQGCVSAAGGRVSHPALPVVGEPRKDVGE